MERSMERSIAAAAIRIGVVTEPFTKWPLDQFMGWLTREAPEVTELEIGVGGYALPGHCDMSLLLKDPAARRRWVSDISGHGLRVGALNVSGNPLHPDPGIGSRHRADLENAVRLAAELGVDRIVAMAGCPAGAAGDVTPHFSGGGWLSYLEGISDRQWTEQVVPYWTTMADFARREYPDLLICLELHPGAVAYNVESFERLMSLGESIAANIDPSHFFWMQMDPMAVVARLGRRVGHAHAKDVLFSPSKLALNGLLDRRWPNPPDEMPWNFAVAGRGHDESWWTRLTADLIAHSSARTIAIEHEDPSVPPELGVKDGAALLARALRPSSESHGRRSI
jgi:sugar phosphate isomerase/epimerase